MKIHTNTRGTTTGAYEVDTITIQIGESIFQITEAKTDEILTVRCITGPLQVCPVMTGRIDIAEA